MLETLCVDYRYSWRVVQGAGWYLPSGPRDHVPGTPHVQGWDYCTSSPGVWADFYRQDPVHNHAETHNYAETHSQDWHHPR